MQRLGVTTIKSSPTLTLVVHLISPNDRYDITYLRNYAIINVKDRLARLNGVGEVAVWGSAITPCAYGWTRRKSPSAA